MQKVAVLASFSVEFVMHAERAPRAGETLQARFAMHLGGRGFNQAVAARRLGADVAVTGRVGDDDFGRMFVLALDEEDIDRRAVLVDPSTSTGVKSITIEPGGATSVVEDAGANRNVSGVEWEHGFDSRDYDGVSASAFFDDVDVAIASLEKGAETAELFFNDMFIAGKRDCMLLDASLLAQASIDIPSFTSTIVLNEAEAQYATGVEIAGTIDAAFKAAHLLHSKVDTVVIRLRAEGAVALRNGTRIHIPAFDVPVVGASGGADAFCAALAVSQQEKSLADAIRFANGASAIACTHGGAASAMPRWDEVEAFLTSGVARQ